MTRSDASGGDIFTKKKALAALMLFALGAFTGLGQAPFDLWPAAVIGFAGILYVMSGGGFWKGWWIGFGYFALVLHWIVEPFLVDVTSHGWMAPFALVLLSGGLALFWGAAGWIAFKASLKLRSIAFGLALIVAEYLRANVLTGFPWGLPAYGVTSSGILPAAATWGPHGIGVLLLAFCCGLALVAQRQLKSGLGICLLAGVAVLFPLATLPQIEDVQDAPTIRIIQPNAPQAEKWQRDKAREFLDRQLAFTAADEPVDLVIWPETAVAYAIGDVAPLAAQAARGGVVMFGAQRFENGRFYNTYVTVGPDGTVKHRYDKHHLVPFGEYIPLGNQLGQLGIRGLAENDGGGFAAGAEPLAHRVGDIGFVLPLICYESIFPNYSSTQGERPKLIVVATNDAWFGQFAGPQQHLQQAQWRAAEQGTPVARSANTGISAMIDARGQITASLGLGEAGFFDTPLPPQAPEGVYARYGRALEWVLIALCFFGLFTLYRSNLRHIPN